MTKRKGNDRDFRARKSLQGWTMYTGTVENKISENNDPSTLTAAQQKIYKVMVASQELHEERNKLENSKVPKQLDALKSNGSSDTQESEVGTVQSNNHSHENSRPEIFPNSEDDSNTDAEIPCRGKERGEKLYKPLSSIDKHKQAQMLEMQPISLQADNSHAPDLNDPLVVGLSVTVTNDKEGSMKKIDWEFHSLNKQIVRSKTQFDELNKLVDDELLAMEGTINSIKK